MEAHKRFYHDKVVVRENVRFIPICEIFRTEKLNCLTIIQKLKVYHYTNL